MMGGQERILMGRMGTFIAKGKSKFSKNILFTEKGIIKRRIAD
jgi:hypothetical protein